MRGNRGRRRGLGGYHGVPGAREIVSRAAPTMKYRLKRDDGVEIDVHGVLWESVLDRAYRYGWRPSGTDEPRTSGWRRGKTSRNGDAPLRDGGGEWPRGDYFSASAQYVRPADARALGTAALRGLTTGDATDAEASERKRTAGERRVAAFVRDGGFVIGLSPEATRSS
jgi:hypothetical protein